MLVSESVARGDPGTAATWCVDALTAARAFPASPIAGYCLVAAGSVAALRGDHEVAAYLHGVVRDTLPALRPSMPPEAVRSHAAVVDQLRSVLGDERFDREAARGASTGPVSGVEDALAYVRAIAPTTASAARDDGERSTLTPRQVEVVRLLAAGLSNKEIAVHLGVAPKTVMHHTTGVYRALGVRSRSEAVAWAFRSGLVA